MTPEECKKEIQRRDAIIEQLQRTIVAQGDSMAILGSLIEQGRQDLLDCLRAKQELQVQLDECRNPQN